VRRIPLWLLPAASVPLLLAGLWLWRDQGALIALGDFIGSCF
jgi:hypothetical protein